MKDKEIRALILQKLYDNRQHHAIALNESLFDGISNHDLFRVILQLKEYGMVKYMGVAEEGHFTMLLAPGVDAVENEGDGAPLEMSFPVTQHITHISHSSNIQVGNQNIQNITNSFKSIITEIENSDFPAESKQEAKGRLKLFLEHPLTSAILGGATGGLLGTLAK